MARANYVTALSRHQRFDEALAENEQLREAQPDNLAHQVQFATTLSMAGRFEPAHGEFAKVLEQAPDNERILTSYGHSLRYGGKGEEAIEISPSRHRVRALGGGGLLELGESEDIPI